MADGSSEIHSPSFMQHQHKNWLSGLKNGRPAKDSPLFFMVFCLFKRPSTKAKAGFNTDIAIL